MEMNKKFKLTVAAVAVSAVISGCSTTMEPKSDLETRLESAEQENAQLRRDLARAESEASRAPAPATSTTSSADNDLLPPNAKPGECYARVLVPEKYEDKTERVLKNAASERVEIVPAEYAMVDEKVLVKEASTVKKVIPARYEMVDEKVLV